MKKAIFGGILGMLLLGSALQAVRIVASVFDPRQLDYGEGIILYQASRIFDLQDAFHPLQQYPHIVFHYTPLFHIALRGVTSILNNPLLSGRLISMASAFWLIGLFATIVLKATRGYAASWVRWFSAITAGAFVLLMPAMHWAPLARVDMLGLALQFTALYLICQGGMRGRNQVAALCLLLLGVYTKQSLLAIPAASLLLIFFDSAKPGALPRRRLCSSGSRDSGIPCLGHAWRSDSPLDSL